MHGQAGAQSNLLDAAVALRDAEGWSADEVIHWALTTFGERCPIVSSLQVESIVMIDIARSLGLDPRVITIDTGRLPEETHDYLQAVRDELDIKVEVLLPDAHVVSAMAETFGTNLFRQDPALRQLCCHVRKVLPLQAALRGLDAWITGLRRDAGDSRSGTPKVQLDPADESLLKLSPLADWTRDEVWTYAEDHGLPVHPLYEKGFPSIGCAPCTRAVRHGAAERSGRWWWEADGKRECGLHELTHEERFHEALADVVAERDES